MPTIKPKRKVSGLIDILNILLQKHQANIDGLTTSSFKIRSFNKMITIMTSFPRTHIVSTEEIENYFKDNGVKNPKKISIIVKEYLKRGSFSEATDAANHPIIKSVLNLTKIYGIGPKNAKKLYEDHGIITIADLRIKVKTEPDIINNKVKIGLKYHTQLEKRIPRNEIDKYKEVIENICTEISPNLKMSINGSYRRGLSTSGDIDILITSNNADDNPGELRKSLIKKLKKEKVIIETLANGKKKFMGIGKLTRKGFTIARHIDIIDTTLNEFPFAVLYFTGSGGFNTNMRTEALKKGYSINEYTISDKNTKTPIDSSKIMSKIGKNGFETEKDIFDFLDIDFVKPEERNTITLSKI